MASICGANCNACSMKDDCMGCEETCGAPFGGICMAAEYIKDHGKEGYAAYKAATVREFNDLHIEGMPPVTQLVEIMGAFVNLPYPLDNGDTVRFFTDKKIYLGFQLPKTGTDRFFGLVAAEKFLLVSEYSANGADPVLVAYRRRKQ